MRCHTCRIDRSPSVGTATMFSGKNRHCGVPVTAGVRYVLAGFLGYDADNDGDDSVEDKEVEAVVSR
jgi:hypothetical protein